MHYNKRLPLKDKEVVLTFDDGPLIGPTDRVLKALAAECVKATFFMVGQMADAYPWIVRKVARAGHTIATHTHNHPRGITTLDLAVAEHDIVDGFRSVAKALAPIGRPAPFFRYPGLRPTHALDAFLEGNGIATFSADIVGDDWRGISSSEILRRVLHRLDHQGSGIILLHDIKPRTAKMLPKLLRSLKQRGYKVVHVVPRREGFGVTLRNAVYQPEDEDTSDEPAIPAKAVEPPESDVETPSAEPDNSVEADQTTDKSVKTAQAP